MLLFLNFIYISVIPPTIEAPLCDLRVADREDIQLQVKADGLPKPRFRWYRNGEEIVSDERKSMSSYIQDDLIVGILSIKAFGMNDDGKLLCVAESCAGKAETSAELTMELVLPVFPKPLPRSAAVDEGGQLELKCKVDGSPYPKLQWFKDGEEIRPSEHVKIDFSPDGNVRLTIDNVTPTDSGAYKLVATNHAGEQSSQCAVAVNPGEKEPTIIKELEDQTLIIREPLLLKAQVTAFPSPQAQWFKDNVPVRQKKGLNFMNEPNGVIGLAIDRVTLEDAGVYTLRVANACGEVSTSGQVQVLEKQSKPEFELSLQPLNVVEGFPVKMQVKAHGNPQPEIQWLKNNEPVNAILFVKQQ